MIPYIKEMFDKYVFNDKEIYTPSLLELFVYKYLLFFSEINPVEKAIIFVDNDEYNYKKNDEILKKFNDCEIFVAPIKAKHLIVFHVTHKNEINNKDFNILNSLFKSLNIYIKEINTYNDEYCNYSITFSIIFNK